MSAKLKIALFYSTLARSVIEKISVAGTLFFYGQVYGSTAVVGQDSTESSSKKFFYGAL